MRHLGKNLVIVLALVAAGFFVAWLRFRSYLGDEGKFSDGTRTYDVTAADGVRYAVWQTPELLDGAVNTSSAESRPALSPDGRWLVFAVGQRGMNSELYVAEMRDGKPVDAKPLATLDTSADECSPAFASDSLYFASDRPGGAGGLDLYRASYANGDFGAAERVGGGVNSSRDDCDPAPRPGTQELAFASNRGGADFDLFTATPDPRGAGFVVSPLAPANTSRDEREPAFTADGRTLFFASNREKATDDFDLYRTSLADGAWSAPAALAGLNTEASERAPLPAFDGFSLYFARASSANDLDLLHARSTELFRLPGRPVGWLDLAILASLLLLSLLAWLAKRWPKLETLYKCYLVSLLVHLLLLWWFRGLFVEGGGAEPGRTRDGIHVKVIPSANTISAATRERGGRLESARSADAGISGPSKTTVAAADLAAGPSALAIEAPRSTDPVAPERHGVASDPAAPAAVVAVAEPTDLARRSGDVPNLALASGAGTSTRPAPAGTGPARNASVALPNGLEAPSVGGIVAAPVAREQEAPARGEVALAPSASSATASVPIAAPPSERSRISGGSNGPSLALDSSTDARGERAASGAPERRADAGRGTQTDASVAPSNGALAALTPAPPKDVPPGSGRASVDPAPAASSPAQVGLRDTETVVKVVEASAPHGGSTASDMLGSLGAATGAREPARESGPPERRSVAPERPDSTPTPRTLALDAPADRPSSEPPRPEKKWENTPYKNRAGEDKSRALSVNGGTKETEVAVAKGLAYLARIQRDTGGWGDHEALDDKYGQIAVGKTGLALLAFLGAGHTHASQTQYSENAGRALAFLIALQDSESGHFGDSDAYSHGIATYALAECYALTGDQQLREPLERAVAHILAKQNHTRDPKRFGGWSYYYADDRVYDRWPRTSITVWQVMALESARLAGLTVPEKVFDDATTFIDNAEDPDQGWYRYNHDPNRLNSAWPTLPASTPAALFALSLVGRDVNAPEFDKARDFVLSRAPRDYRRGSDDEFVRRGQGNLYFWYYGTLSMFRAGGNAWQRWNAAMKECLVRGQRTDGSWAPIDVYCNYARDDEHDKSYSTAMCVLSLEVYYRYYLPLLKVR